MSFLSGLFNKKQTKSVVLIDISAHSVAGAYVRYTEGAQPILIYSRRLPVEVRGNEPEEQAMLRALKNLGENLIYDGAPRLVRAVGEGNVHSILVSVDAPWRKTSIRTEHFEQKIPFIFDKNMMQTALEKGNTVPAGWMLVDESIVGTILNGYETRNPYGKQAHRASVSVLTSYVDEHCAKEIHAMLRSVYHTKEITFIASSSLRYQAMRIMFPHQRDVLILDAVGSLISIVLVRGGLLVEIIETSNRAARPAEWLKEISAECAELARRFPLPRTLFLLAHESETVSKKEVLDTIDFGKLWLSDNPPKIVSVLGSHLNGLVQQSAATPPDLSLLLMSLYLK